MKKLVLSTVGLVLTLSNIAFAQNMQELGRIPVPPVTTVAPQALTTVSTGLSLADRETLSGVETAANQSAAAVQAACGNSSFVFNYNWAAYDQVDYKLAMDPNVTKIQFMSRASMFSSDVSKALVQICANPAGRTAVAQLTGVNLTPRPDNTKGFGMHVVKNGTILDADYYPFGRSGSQDLAADIKKAL